MGQPAVTIDLERSISFRFLFTQRLKFDLIEATKQFSSTLTPETAAFFFFE